MQFRVSSEHQEHGLLFNFPASERLDKRELKKVFKEGRRYRDGFLTMVALCREEGPSKGGAIVRNSRKSAVARNRYKRILREAYRLNRHRIKGSFWMALILTRQEEELPFSVIEERFKKLCRKAGMMNNQ